MAFILLGINTVKFISVLMTVVDYTCVGILDTVRLSAKAPCGDPLLSIPRSTSLSSLCFSSFITDEFALFLAQIKCLQVPKAGRLCGNVEYYYVPVASLLLERVACLLPPVTHAYMMHPPALLTACQVCFVLFFPKSMRSVLALIR